MIEGSGQLKPVREARIAAITALAIYQMTGKPAYVQLCKDDPPDAYIGQKSLIVPGQLDVSTIEITSFRENPREDFLTQIKRTKIPPNYQKYSKNYVLVVDLLTRNPIDEIGINTYLNEVKVPFPILTFKALSISPDTIGEMVILNPNISRFTINFGEVAYKMKKSGTPESFKITWIKSPDQLRDDQHTGTYSLPPWDPNIENV